MTEETTATEETVEPTPEIDPDANVREHKAFKAVTSQLSAERKAVEKLQAQMDKYSRAEEQRKLDSQKTAGDFEAAERTYMERIAALEVAADESKQHAIQQQTIADLKIQLTSKGVTDLNHVDMLSDRYLKLEEAPDVDAWVAEIALKDSYSVFFQRGKPGMVAPPNQQAAASVANKPMVELQKDLRDPEKAKAASSYITSYFAQHGEMPK